MRKRRVFRQGDVVLIEEVPRSLVLEERFDRLEIRGETGNAHVLEAPVVLDPLTDRQYVEVKEPTPLTHPEHATLIIPPGTYRVTTVRDWRYNRGDWGQVRALD